MKLSDAATVFAGYSRAVTRPRISLRGGRIRVPWAPARDAESSLVLTLPSQLRTITHCVRDSFDLAS
jgi:hypothetical protein